MNLSIMLNPVEVRSHEDVQMNLDLPTTSSMTGAKYQETLIPLRELLKGIASLPEFQSQNRLACDESRAIFVCRDHRNLSVSPRLHEASHTTHHGPFRQEQTFWNHPSQTSQEEYLQRRHSIESEEDSVMSDYSLPSLDHTSQIHNNNKYTVEMIDWIRYHRVDRGLPWEAELLPRFFDQFPERYHPKATVQTLTSRYYRDNTVPELDENGKWQIDEKGHLKLQSAKVRSRSTVVGKDIPRGLVDKWPARLLTYTNWKCPVLEKDRERARKILSGNDPTDPHGSK